MEAPPPSDAHASPKKQRKQVPKVTTPYPAHLPLPAASIVIMADKSTETEDYDDDEEEEEEEKKVDARPDAKPDASAVASPPAAVVVEEEEEQQQQVEPPPPPPKAAAAAPDAMPVAAENPLPPPPPAPPVVPEIVVRGKKTTTTTTTEGAPLTEYKTYADNDANKRLGRVGLRWGNPFLVTPAAKTLSPEEKKSMDKRKISRYLKPPVLKLKK